MGSTENSWKKYRHVGVGTFQSTTKMYRLIMDVLRSGQISYGKYSQMLEKQFGQAHGCQYAILSNSGTSALQVALQALKEIHRWNDGAQVIVPATTFVATANIVRHCRLRPVFVDVDPDTYNMDIEKADTVMGKDTVAVIPVHLFGQAADVTRLKQVIAEKKLDIKIIEDSCETMFATHHHNAVGSLGDIGCFSTYVAHLLVTGVGGISLTNNPEYAGKMRSLVNHGLMLEFLNPDENFAPQPMIGRRFKFDTYGHSYRITELEAALGVAQIDEVPGMIRTRARNARHITARLDMSNLYYGAGLHLPTIADGNTHSWMMYPIVLEKNDNGSLRDKEPLMAYLNERGIETRDMLPVLNQPIYSWLSAEDYPVSKWILASGFYIGCHQGMQPSDCDYVGDVFMSYFSEPSNRERLNHFSIPVESRINVTADSHG